MTLLQPPHPPTARPPTPQTVTGACKHTLTHFETKGYIPKRKSGFIENKLGGGGENTSRVRADGGTAKSEQLSCNVYTCVIISLM